LLLVCGSVSHYFFCLDAPPCGKIKLGFG
jgi:hypothetical protein